METKTTGFHLQFNVSCLEKNYLQGEILTQGSFISQSLQERLLPNGQGACSKNQNLLWNIEKSSFSCNFKWLCNNMTN